jgi:hypothetical protein
MGQYHVIVNLDKKECIWSHGLGAGLKLWEQLANHPSTQEALLVLLACSNGRGGGDLGVNDPNRVIGRWAGDRIAVVGDYAEFTDLPEQFMADTIYGECHENEDGTPRSYRDITKLVRPIIERELGGHFVPPDYDPKNWDSWLKWKDDGGDNG